jgi:hypothetical protein
MKKDCSNCKYLQQSVYLKLENETLCNVWCKVKSLMTENCDKFKAKK